MLLEYLWMIEAELRTTTCLAIGNGGEYENEAGVRISTVATTCFDKVQRAGIPGSALRGACRAAAENDGLNVDLVLGSAKQNNPDGLATGQNGASGSRMAFLDAPSVKSPALDPGESWDSTKRTCTRASTAIDSHTGTADIHKLYNQEFVPEGVVFRIRIQGKSYQKTGLTLQDVLKVLKPGLALLGSGLPVLGSGSNNGWGAFAFDSAPTIRKMDSAAIRTWLAAPHADNNYAPSISAQLEAATSEVLPLDSLAPKTSKVKIQTTIEINHGFLVNDPVLAGRAAEGKDSHAAIRRNGKAFAPEKSIRGILRSQAKRVVRTLGADILEPDVSSTTDLRSLGPFASLFGCPGWRAPLEVERFSPVQNSEFCSQEFVAVDRFTGGGVESRKFTAEGAWGSNLVGTISIDLDRLAQGGGNIGSLGLLALVFRDLAEGDLTVGWGSSRGYGQVSRVSFSVAAVPLWQGLPEAFRTISETDYNTLTGDAPWPHKRTIIAAWVAAFHQGVQNAVSQ